MSRNIMPDEHYLEFPFVLCIVRGIKMIIGRACRDH